MISWDSVDGDFRARLESALEHALGETIGEEGTLAKACHYAVLGGGKRLRPLATLAVAEDMGGATQESFAAACALEFIHAYSLVHDDLPAMDDDDERRGRATVHRAFDEATAILVGDALLTAAFEIAPLSCVRRLAQSAGGKRLILGQMQDLSLQTTTDITQVHNNKTGALFSASLAFGGITAGATTGQIETLAALGEALGIAFQFRDDLLDGENSQIAVAARTQWTERAEQQLHALGHPLPRLSALCVWIASA